MSESTLVSSLNSQLPEPPGPTPTPRGEPTPIAPEAGATAAETTGDRLQLSFETVERIVAGRVRTVLRDVLAEEGPGRARGRLQAAANRLDRSLRALTKFLERAGALDKETAKELKALYRQTRGDLQSVVRDLPEDGDDDGEASVVAVEASREVGVSESRSFSLEVRTREGDVATLELQRSASADYSAAFAAADGTLTRSEILELSRQTSLTYTVVGDLNEDERSAIDELLENVDGVADRFFDGDLQAALQDSLELGFDETEIEGFSLNLSRSLELYAASSYQVVQALGSAEEESTLPRPAEENRQAVGDLLNRLRELAEAPTLNIFFVDPGDLVKQAFRGATATDPRLDPGDGSLRALIERLLDAV